MNISDHISLNSSWAENILHKIVEKIRTHILYTKTFSENRAFYEIMWKNTVELDRP